MTKRYLSFGAGRNSVALYILLMQNGLEPGVDFEAVFADPGAEMPETYQYIEWMQDNGYPVTIVPGVYKGSPNDASNGLNLIEHCRRLRILPSPWRRWCTDKFKVRPLKRYYGTQAGELLGITVDDSRYERFQNNRDGVTMPLGDQGVTEEDCLTIIRDAGWPMLVKSGCFFCPMQRLSEIEALAQNHPDLFAIAVGLEDACVEKHVGRG
jgi:hypothetical protein